MKRMLRSTAGGKTGAIDGLNLFFGALLGANLGTVQGLSLLYYIELISILAATVMTLRMISTSPRRTFMLISVALYAIIVGAFLLLPPLQPKGASVDDLHRLAATLATWMFFVVSTELTPVNQPEEVE